MRAEGLGGRGLGLNVLSFDGNGAVEASFISKLDEGERRRERRKEGKGRGSRGAHRKGECRHAIEGLGFRV